MHKYKCGMLFVLLAVLLVLPQVGKAGQGKAGQCTEAKLTLKGFLASLPAEAFLCDAVADCQPYFLSADPCDPPIIMGLRGDVILSNIMSGLLPLQQKARAACPVMAAHACEPNTPRFECVKNICTVVEAAE